MLCVVCSDSQMESSYQIIAAHVAADATTTAQQQQQMAVWKQLLQSGKEGLSEEEVSRNYHATHYLSFTHDCLTYHRCMHCLLIVEHILAKSAWTCALSSPHTDRIHQCTINRTVTAAVMLFAEVICLPLSPHIYCSTSYVLFCSCSDQLSSFIQQYMYNSICSCATSIHVHCYRHRQKLFS